MTSDLEKFAHRAQEGDRAALEKLILAVQPNVYRLALRMLWHPEDAKDATQEILLKLVTHLSTFRRESAFSTWTYRIAANHLLTLKKSRVEAQGLTFELFGKDLEEGLADHADRPDALLLLQEIRVGCTLGMLLCLDRPHRLAYILGEILGLDSAESAAILELNPAAFRKRLERARAEIVAFMKARCGLANEQNRCRCSRRVERAIELKRVDPGKLLFARDADAAARFPQILANIRTLEDTQRAVALFRSQPDFAVPDFTAAVRALLRLQSPG